MQIERLEDVSSTLEELWISYNQINSLDGLSCCSNLTTLYMSNNQIKAWSELDKLVGVLLLLVTVSLILGGDSRPASPTCGTCFLWATPSTTRCLTRRRRALRYFGAYRRWPRSTGTWLSLPRGNSLLASPPREATCV